uniref:Uncharacterized protein n=1 Tax=Timema cristinae TaxID=61476 RepID=A0A7R9DFQ9_TIMCR|nr:unnamed protein product [Timema cristinae]
MFLSSIPINFSYEPPLIMTDIRANFGGHIDAPRKTYRMGPDIQEFFTCAEDLINKFSRVLTFQNGHRQRITSYLFNVNAKYKILKKETQRLAEAIKALEKKVKEK